MQLIAEGEPVPFDKLRAGSERSRRDARETSGAYGENFAEQSQFAPGLMGSTSFMERGYDDTAHPETAGNKAKKPSSEPFGYAQDKLRRMVWG